MIYPDIDPVALQLGPLKIHWYGLMYLLGFLSAWWLGSVRAKSPGSNWTKEQVSDLIFYGAVGLILGARLGYILFYNFSAFLDDFAILFKIWEGGMSFHGGLLGVLIAFWLFGRKTQKNFFQISDFIVPMAPIGLGAGRIGNFINGELLGRPADPALPWSMIYPHVDSIARHPSSLYQALTEGALLFIILWIYSSKPRPLMSTSALFLLLYGAFRFTTEFFREPDSHLGFIAFNWMTMGQLLSLPMIVFGVGLLVYSFRRAKQ